VATRDLKTTKKEKKAESGALSFSDELERRANDPRLPKRERTRNRFKAGAARILESEGYHPLQMSRVCKELGLSQGSIYNYFKDKKELALEVMTEFCERQFDVLRDAQSKGDAFSKIYEATLAHVRFFSLNVGLTRCLSHLCDEMPEFTELWHRLNYGWIMLNARAFQRRAGVDDWNAALALARSLGALVDGVAHEVYVRRNPNFGEYAESPERLAELLSVLWHRTAYAGNPESERLDTEYPLLAFTIQK
jgi:AcrR family transcriptional regulator